MPFVAILGAGPLGGILTHTLSSRAAFDEVRLLDPSGTVAAGQALDVRQAGPPDAVSTRVTGHAAIDAAAGAWVLVLADLLPYEAPGNDELTLVRHAVAVAPGAMLVCAGWGHHRLLPRLVGEGIIAPDLLVASAPSAVAAAARALVAAHVDRSPQDVAVSLAVDADRPDDLGIDWPGSSIDGRPAEAVLPRAHRRRLDERLALSLPPGPISLAASAARVAEAAWFGGRAAQAAWVVDRTIAGPVAAGTGAARAHLVTVRFTPGGRLERLPDAGPRP